MIIRINSARALAAMISAVFLTGCGVTNPPPLPANNPAEAAIPVPADAPRNVLRHDETTLAIHAELSKTDAGAKSGGHTSHGDMPGMQQSEMKREDQKGPTAADVEREKKAIAGEMKKTDEEMKQTSEQLKKKIEESKTQAFYYTCVMHPEIHQDKPGKCPKCGMTLVKKEGTPPK